MERNRCNLFEFLSHYFTSKTEENTKKLRIVSDAAEIRIGLLPSTNKKRGTWADLPGWFEEYFVYPPKMHHVTGQVGLAVMLGVVTSGWLSAQLLNNITEILFCVSFSHLLREYIECSFCRLIRCPGSFLESLIGRQCGSPRQTEGHSFGDLLISAVLRHQVLQKLPAIVLCSVSLCLLWDTCRTKSFYLRLLCENKLIEIIQKKISP
jgi:hypothetical protein